MFIGDEAFPLMPNLMRVMLEPPYINYIILRMLLIPTILGYNKIAMKVKVFIVKDVDSGQNVINYIYQSINYVVVIFLVSW